MIALVVEDNVADRKLLRQYFLRRGWEVVEAANGEEGFAAAKQSLPDLIVSDALMPKMDGFEFLWNVRNSKLSTTPFIMYTATYLHEMDRDLTLEAGADAFLRKPLLLDEFWREVDKVLARREQGEMPRVHLNETEFLRHYRDVLIEKITGK